MELRRDQPLWGAVLSIAGSGRTKKRSMGGGGGCTQATTAIGHGTRALALPGGGKW